jgi:hypothetical protein
VSAVAGPEQHRDVVAVRARRRQIRDVVTVQVADRISGRIDLGGKVLTILDRPVPPCQEDRYVVAPVVRHDHVSVAVAIEVVDRDRLGPGA